jgi:acyl carrier protein
MQIDESLKLVLSRQFGVETDKIHNETHLVNDLGADSLDLIEIVMNIEHVFSIKIEEEEYQNASTISKIVELIKLKQK